MKIISAILILFLLTITKNAYSTQWALSDKGVSYYLNNYFEIYDMQFVGSKILYQLKSSSELVLCIVNINGTTYWPDNTTCWYEQNIN